MRNLAILGCFLCATALAGCIDDAVLCADFKYDKCGKVKGGELELVLYGTSDSEEWLEDLTCEDKKELKNYKIAIVKEDENSEDGFKPVAFAKRPELEDENCDGYTDFVFEFPVRKLVRCGVLDEYTEELLVVIYEREDCEWVAVEGDYIPLVDCEDYEDDCDYEDDDCDYKNDGWKSDHYGDSSNGDGYDCEKEKSYDGHKDWKSNDCEKEEKSYDCDGYENGSSDGDNNCEYKKKKKDCDNEDGSTPS